MFKVTFFFLNEDFCCASDQQGAAQLLEGVGGRLLDSLKDVLVERNQLTLGKELGKGQTRTIVSACCLHEQDMNKT